MNANQFLHYQLFIEKTHDAFILDAKSIAAARDEAEAILKDFVAEMTPRQITSIFKSCKIQMYTSVSETPAFLNDENLLHTVQL